ncbi:TolC family protein [Thermogutta sp.]|uniref:TolC family protein n=1 Tax=Thermogutta sp. TaxID=1962930 RepID=UPI0032207769
MCAVSNEPPGLADCGVVVPEEAHSSDGVVPSYRTLLHFLCLVVAIAQLSSATCFSQSSQGASLSPDFLVIADREAYTQAASLPLFTLAQALRLAEQTNPKLKDAIWMISVARGKALQSRLYPNPVFSINGEELSDPEGPGIWTAPFVSQELVIPGKRSLDQAIAHCELERSRCLVAAEWRKIAAAIRQAYCEVLLAEKRAQTYRELLSIAEASLNQSRALLESRQGTRLEVVQFELQVERLRAQQEAAERQIPFQKEKLAAAIGAQIPAGASFEDIFSAPLPDYDWDGTLQQVLASHPEVSAAQWEVQRARYLSERMRKEKWPNVTLGAGYTRQNETRGDDWTLGVSVPLPLWDRNQGNIMAADAQVSQALERVRQVKEDLRDQLATTFRDYFAARKRVQRYEQDILPRVREAVQLSMQGYTGGIMEYLRVLEAQRSEIETRLDYLANLADAWQAAARISGIVGEKIWPSRDQNLSAVQSETSAKP